MKRFSRSSLTTMAVCLLFIPALLKAQPRPAHRKKVGVVLSGGGAKGNGAHRCSESYRKSRYSY